MQRCRIEFIAISAPFSHQVKNFWDLETVHGAASRVCEGAAQEQERQQAGTLLPLTGSTTIKPVLSSKRLST